MFDTSKAPLFTPFEISDGLSFSEGPKKRQSAFSWFQERRPPSPTPSLQESTASDEDSVPSDDEVEVTQGSLTLAFGTGDIEDGFTELHDVPLVPTMPSLIHEFDNALVHERQDHVGEITLSMRPYHQVPAETLLDAQDKDFLQSMSMQALESFQLSQSGLEKLVQEQKQRTDERSTKKKFLYTAAVATMVVVSTAAWWSTQYAQDSIATGGNVANFSQSLLVLN